jgi:hypothetical protein
MKYQEIRRLADRLRGVPPGEIIPLFGGVPHHYDKAKWNTALGMISVTGMKFHNWNQDAGGGGAIDLVMHLGEMDFKSAVFWLREHFHQANALQSQLEFSTQASGLRLPQESRSKWSQVLRYLTGQRHLPQTIIRELHEKDMLYADRRGNAVFLHLSTNRQPTGAELRGTTAIPWRGMAPGSRKALGYFSVGNLKSETVIICESAIDAISCLTIHPQALCISTAGVNPHPAWLPEVIRKRLKIYCGFDADTAGDQMAQRMIKRYPEIQRLRPIKQDWNQQIIKPNQ